MESDYPDSYDTFRSIENVPGQEYDEDNTTRLYAEDIEKLDDCIEAIEGTLGLNPQGSYDDVKIRLDSNPNDFELFNIKHGAEVVGRTLLGNYPTATLSISDGSLYLIPIIINYATDITKIRFYQGTQGVYTADNNNKIGLYSYSEGYLTLLGSTSNNGNLYKNPAGTFNTFSFSSPITVSPGLYYVGFLYNNSAQTTAPTLGVLPSPVSVNIDDLFGSACPVVFGVKTGQSDLPSSVALNTFSGTARAIFCTLVDT